MADIFGTKPKFGDAISVDETTLTFDVGSGSDGGLGALVQSVTASYQRPIQRLFELGQDKNTYYLVGRAEGNCAIQRLAAPGPINYAFLRKFADVCQVDTNHFTLGASTGLLCDRVTAVDSRHTFNHCLITGIQFSISVQAISLTEGVNLVFAAMDQE